MYNSDTAPPSHTNAFNGRPDFAPLTSTLRQDGHSATSTALFLILPSRSALGLLSQPLWAPGTTKTFPPGPVEAYSAKDRDEENSATMVTKSVSPPTPVLSGVENISHLTDSMGNLKTNTDLSLLTSVLTAAVDSFMLHPSVNIPNNGAQNNLHFTACSFSELPEGIRFSHTSPSCQASFPMHFALC